MAAAVCLAMSVALHGLLIYYVPRLKELGGGNRSGKPANDPGSAALVMATGLEFCVMSRLMLTDIPLATFIAAYRCIGIFNWMPAVRFLLSEIVLVMKRHVPLQAKYQNAVVLSGLAAFIAAYRYVGIFNWMPAVRLLLSKIFVVMKLDALVQAIY